MQHLRRRPRIPRHDPWHVAGASIQGPVRPENQDAYIAGPVACGVFDGVGGMPNGKEAAQAAADHLVEAMVKDDPLQFLHAKVKETGGATTAVVVNLADRPTVWTVGDSGAIRVRGSEAMCLTPSDGVGNVLSQSLGIDDVDAHRADVVMTPGDVLVLCTDGVHRTVPLDRLANLVQDRSPESAVRAVLDAVAAEGAPDNATIVVCRYGP